MKQGGNRNRARVERQTKEKGKTTINMLKILFSFFNSKLVRDQELQCRYISLPGLGIARAHLYGALRGNDKVQ